MDIEPNDLVKQRAKQLFEHLNLFDWKLGIRGTNDDMYFTKLGSLVFNTLETNDLIKIKTLLDRFSFIQSHIEKGSEYKYKHIYNEVTA